LLLPLTRCCRHYAYAMPRHGHSLLIISALATPYLPPRLAPDAASHFHYCFDYAFF